MARVDGKHRSEILEQHGEQVGRGPVTRVDPRRVGHPAERLEEGEDGLRSENAFAFVEAKAVTVEGRKHDSQ